MAKTNLPPVKTWVKMLNTSEFCNGIMLTVHGLIANAGISGPTKPVWEYYLKEWERVLSVDLTGVFLTTRTLLNHFREQNYGRLVIVASVAGKEGNPGTVPYGAAKAGVIRYAKGLALELLPSRITVNCLAPAITKTELLKEVPDTIIEEKKSLIPMERFCTPEEIADMPPGWSVHVVLSLMDRSSTSQVEEPPIDIKSASRIFASSLSVSRN